MKIKHRNCMLPVEMLYPHPDNPRKDLGDLSELAESIKKDGIFQNLTVVLGGKGPETAHPGIDDPDGYTIIIGHRRLAAAKLAGLTEVPCMVAEMSENEQVATMLLENMQRNDLTVYEQAQGFQMMLDLGETQSSIAEKTGLSKTTVRHRLKLLELDAEEFKKSQERQPSITDYIELEKISDPELKNKALAAIGTKDFAWEVSRAVDKEKRDKWMAEWIAFLNQRLERIEMSEKSGKRYIAFYTIRVAITDPVKEEIEQKIADGGCYYAYDGFGSVYIVGEKIEEKPTPEDEQREKEKEEQKKKIEKIVEIENLMHELRKDFVAEYDTIANDEEILSAFLTETGFDDINYWTAADVLKINHEDMDDAEELMESEEWKDKVDFRPSTIILALLYSIYDDYSYDRMLHTWDGKYEKNKKLEKWYEILKISGYKISSTEKKMLNGTHEVFGEANEA